jgi:hypothetical protein
MVGGRGWARMRLLEGLKGYKQMDRKELFKSY